MVEHSPKILASEEKATTTSMCNWQTNSLGTLKSSVLGMLPGSRSGGRGRSLSGVDMIFLTLSFDSTRFRNWVYTSGKLLTPVQNVHLTSNKTRLLLHLTLTWTLITEHVAVAVLHTYMNCSKLHLSWPEKKREKARDRKMHNRQSKREREQTLKKKGQKWNKDQKNL